VLVCVMTIGYAQQSEYSQYYINLPATNAAFTGMDGFLNLKAGFRQGWNDFEDKNNSVFVSAFGSLNKPVKQMTRSNALRISDPSVFKKLETNKKLRRKHGVGGIISSKTLGPYQRTQLFLNYAYHLPISKKLNWAMGTKVGYVFEEIDFSGYTVRDEVNDSFYKELITSNSGRQSSLHIDLGTVLYSKSFYVGISSNGVINTELSSDNNLQNDVLGQFQMQTGTMFDLSPNIEMSWSAAGSYTDGFDPTWMISSRVKFKDVAYVGVGYEYDQRVSLMVGLISSGQYAIHYSYDKYISQLSNFNINSHEVVLGISIFNKFKLRSKFW